MRRPSRLAALFLSLPFAAAAQTPSTSTKGKSPSAKKNATTAQTAAPGATAKPTATPTPTPSAAAAQRPLDAEEFRRQVMEEVRRELQKARDEVKQEANWMRDDNAARLRDAESLESLKQRVNLFQPHGYFRVRGEFMNNFDLGRGPDRTGHSLFPTPFVGTGGNHSQSDVNMRFRFEPTFAISEDLAVFGQIDILDNVLLGSDPRNEPFLDPFTPLSILTRDRLASAVRVKRFWGRVNTQLGELLFGRMGYHWGLGILHNDGNCLDCDFGDTYDRIAFAPREIKGHHFVLMFDLLDKGAGTRGEFGELGRSVDLDTLDDGYRLALEVTRLATPEKAKSRIDAGQWVFDYGLVLDYRTQGWDTPVPESDSSAAGPRQRLVRRGAKLYEPDIFVSFRRRRFRLDAEIASRIGNVATRATRDVDPLLHPDLTQGLTFLQFGGALQSDIAFLSADALLLGLELGAASGDRGAYGFGARPWRSGSGNPQAFPDANAVTPGTPPGTPFRATGPGDIDGTHIDFSGNPTHGRINNFAFNRAFNVDTILFRNIVTAITSSWYLKPSIRYRPSGRKAAGGDDTGFELFASLMYASAWYSENTPGLQKPLGLELNIGLTYDTSDRFHSGLTYGLLLPFGGLRAPPSPGSAGRDPSVAHAIRYILAIPF